MKHIIAGLLMIFAGMLTVVGQNRSVSLSGNWAFQIDREDKGVREEWFGRILEDRINLPGSMPEKLKGDEVTVRTRWTGSLYDSSYYFNPYMEKYRIDGQVKLPFFLHRTGITWVWHGIRRGYRFRTIGRGSRWFSFWNVPT